MKKKKKGKIILGIIVVFIIGTIALGASDDSNENVTSAVTETKEEVSDENKEETKDDKAETSNESTSSEQVAFTGQYICVGDTVEGDGANYTLQEIGILDFPKDYQPLIPDAYSTKYMYIIVEFENTSNEELLFDYECALYIDDYQYEINNFVQDLSINGVPFTSFIDINAGRKMKTFFYTLIPKDADTAEKVELELFGTFPILFKESGNWVVEGGTNTDDFTVENTSSDTDPFAGTELEGMVAVKSHDGVYISYDIDTVITVSGDGKYVSAQFTSLGDFDDVELSVEPVEYAKYSVNVDGELIEFTFLGERSLLVSGRDFGGWYQLN